MKKESVRTARYPREKGRGTGACRGIFRRAACVFLCVLISLSLSGCTLSGDTIKELIQSGLEFFGIIEESDTVPTRPTDMEGDNEQPIVDVPGDDTANSGQNGSVDDGTPAGADKEVIASHNGHQELHRNNPNNYDSTLPFDGLSAKDFRLQGSALELRGDVVLIGVFVEKPTDPWKEKDLDLVSRNMDIACAWLEDQAASHDVPLDIHYGEPNTTFRIESDALSVDSTDTEEIFTFNKEVAHFLYNLDTSAIKERYGTDNVGFLLFIHEDYGAYTWPYEHTGTGIDRYYYNEFCCLFLYDGIGVRSYENPATYAHEILHLFGASDLYEVNEREGITTDLMQYVQTEYPHEIMYYTYEDDDTSNYNEITKMLSPFTTYFLGWDDGEEILKDWPGIKRDAPGAF